MAAEAQKRAKNKYAKKIKRVGVAFYPNDMEIYEYLCKKPNKAGYIKELIQKDMESNL